MDAALPTVPPPGSSGQITPQLLKGAFKAFKKRIKLMRLDKESGKIGGPLSSGKSSGIVAITPPAQFPAEVWEALVKEKKLIYAGHGTYELADDNQ